MDWYFVHVPKTAGCSIEYTLERKPGIHMPVSAVPGHEFYFAFVRNPYDRIVSGYFYRQRRNSMLKNYLKKFRKWLLSEGVLADMVVDEVFRPMGHYLDAPVDFIGRYETLQDDFDKVCKIIGEEPRTLIRDNVTEHPLWQSLYDPALLARVYELYRDDFKTFGYKRLTSVNE